MYAKSDVEQASNFETLLLVLVLLCLLVCWKPQRPHFNSLLQLFYAILQFPFAGGQHSVLWHYQKGDCDWLRLSVTKLT